MQYARPTSTVSSATWGYVGASFHGAIADVVTPGNEDVDTTYIFATAGGSVTNCEVLLSTVTDPVSSSDHTVYFKHKTTTVPPYAAPNDLTVSLYDGATLIASVTVEPTGTETESSFLLSGPEADAITDYSDLRIALGYNYGGFGDEIRIYSAYMVVPDAGAGSGGGVTVDEPSIVHLRPYDRFQHQTGVPEMLTNYEQTGPEEEEYPWYARPDGYFDGVNSKICNRSGLRFPARMAVYVDGNWYGKPFAPDPDPTFGAIDATDYLE